MYLCERQIKTKEGMAMIELLENKQYFFKRLDDFVEVVKEEDSKKSFQTVQFADWSMTEDGFKLGKKVHKMKDSGMKTLLRLFKMPVNFYYDTSPTDMLVRDVNRMKKEYTPDSEMTVYFSGGDVRAVSRPDVGHIENHQKLLDSLGSLRGQFHRASFNDYGIRVMTSDADKPIKVEKGDIINFGMEVMYSDIGYYPATGYPFLNRLICTNGAVMQEKSDFLTGFRFQHSIKTPEDAFLKLIHDSVQKVGADSKVLSSTFKAMKDNTVKVLHNGEIQMKKIRGAMGSDEFDKHEIMIKKIIEKGSKERVVINPDLNLYEALDLTTRTAKKFHHLERRKIESLAGGLITMSAKQFVH